MTGNSTTAAPGPARPSTRSRRLERSLKRRLASWAARLSQPQRLTPQDILQRPIHRLLVVRQHNQMGDMVLALPALRALRRAFPAAHLTFVTAPLCCELLQGHTDIDELLVFRKERMWKPWQLAAFLWRLRHPRFDLAVVMGTVSFSTTSALLAWASGARRRAGVSSQPFGSELSRAVYHLELPLAPEDLHESERNLVPVRALRLSTAGALETPLLIPSPDALVSAQRRLEAAISSDAPERRNPLVVLHCGAGKAPNIWPASRFAALATSLQERLRARIVLSEGPRDGAIVARVEAGMIGGALRWCQPLPETMGLLRLANLVISNDTGIAHVAAALDTETLVLFGPTDARRWRPIGSKVHVLEAEHGKIEEIAVEPVFAAAASILEPYGFPVLPSRISDAI